ncbi:hypothetical protein BHE74_00058545, partial [Ensete ventricosum]
SAVRALTPPVYPTGYLRRVGHVGGPAVRGCDDLTARAGDTHLPLVGLEFNLQHRGVQGLHLSSLAKVFAALADHAGTFGISLVVAHFRLIAASFGFGFASTRAFGFPLLFAAAMMGLACDLVGAASLAFSFGLVFSLTVEDNYIFTNFTIFQQCFILRLVHYYAFIVNI